MTFNEWLNKDSRTLREELGIPSEWELSIREDVIRDRTVFRLTREGRNICVRENEGPLTKWTGLREVNAPIKPPTFTTAHEPTIIQEMELDNATLGHHQRASSQQQVLSMLYDFVRGVCGPSKKVILKSTPVDVVNKFKVQMEQLKEKSDAAAAALGQVTKAGERLKVPVAPTPGERLIELEDE